MTGTADRHGAPQGDLGQSLLHARDDRLAFQPEHDIDVNNEIDIASHVVAQLVCDETSESVSNSRATHS
jgi:hypothetical protein